MSALGAELAGTFARGFALLADLRLLAPDEHRELMHRIVAQVAAVTREEQAARAGRGSRETP